MVLGDDGIMSDTATTGKIIFFKNDPWSYAQADPNLSISSRLSVLIKLSTSSNDKTTKYSTQSQIQNKKSKINDKNPPPLSLYLSIPAAR